MSRSNGRLLVLAATLLSVLVGCIPPAQEVRQDRLTIEVTDVWSLQVEARLPTDVLPLPDGGMMVLDGYRGRALIFDATREVVRPIGDPDDWGRPVRLAAARDEGVWLVEPEAATLRRTLLDGKIVETLLVEGIGGDDDHDFEPMAVYDAGDALVAPLRTGPIAWVDPTSGKVLRTQGTDVDDLEFGGITDISPSAEGGFLLPDTLGNRVHITDADGSPISWFGRRGMWAGYMLKPKAIAQGPEGTIIVADSALGVVQVFDPAVEVMSERALGMVAEAGEPLPFEHPIAVERIAGTNDYLVLDMLTETVWGFTITAEALAEARTKSTVRALRDPLVEQEGFMAGIGSKTCLECHDGLLNDDRQNWDPDRVQHPVDMVPERELPVFFPVDTGGEMRCVTCHSPHGLSTMEEVAGVETQEQVFELVRHQPEEDMFTRLTRHDASLCMACHDKDPHKAAAEAAGATGEGHPSGIALLEKLEDIIAEKAASGDETAAELAALPKGCLTCHAVHGASGKSLGRGAADGTVCIACHEERVEEKSNHPILNDLFDEEGKPLPFPRRSAKLPVASTGGATCLSCHNLVGGSGDSLIREPEDGGVVCVVCHQDKDLLAGAFETEGPDAVDIDDIDPDDLPAHARIESRSGVPCLGCHGTHGASAEDSFLVTLGSSKGGDTTGCMLCHGPGGQAHKDGIRPGSVGHPVTGRRHRGLDEPLTCLICHDPHTPTAGKKAECTRCHTDQVESVKAGGHGEAKCSDCHTVHRSPPMAFVSGQDYNQRTLRCLGCHGARTGRGDTPRITEIEHPKLRLKSGRRGQTEIGDLRLFGSGGEQLAPGALGDITCSTCHRTHGPHPTNPLDKLRRPGIKDSCEECHGEEAEARYKYFHEPDKRAFLDVWAP